jgi:hypothetical protein
VGLGIAVCLWQLEDSELGEVGWAADHGLLALGDLRGWGACCCCGAGRGEASGFTGEILG